MAIAQGQFTIVDFNDAISLTGFISSNHPKVQFYNQDTETFFPNWSTNNLVLSPSIYKVGNLTDLITSDSIVDIKWYEGLDSTTPLTTNSNYTVNTTGLRQLIVKTNILLEDVYSMDYVCEITFHDDLTGLNSVYKTSINLSKVISGSSSVTAYITNIDGTVFKNNTSQYLRLRANLYRGSSIQNSLTSVQWFQQDASITSNDGYLYDADAGEGWRRLSVNLTGMYTGVKTNELKLYSSIVSNSCTFKVQIQDINPNSETYLQYFYDTITINDLSDPLQIRIISTGGNMFKNGSGSTELSVMVHRGEEEITNIYNDDNFRWYKYGADGEMVSSWGGTVDYKTGKIIALTGSDVDNKATFVVQLV